MSSKAVANEVMEEGALSVRREGLRVEVEETTDLVSASRSRSRSRLERAVSARVVVLVFGGGRTAVVFAGESAPHDV
jgi:hypothetical protein